MHLLLRAVSAACAALFSVSASAQQQNIVLFVADGMRAVAVSPELTSTMARVRAEGIDFRNSHSLFPTVTTANASAIATRHYFGDTSDFWQFDLRPLSRRECARRLHAVHPG
jgi:hypothetical protein